MELISPEKYQLSYWLWKTQYWRSSPRQVTTSLHSHFERQTLVLFLPFKQISKSSLTPFWHCVATVDIFDRWIHLKTIFFLLQCTAETRPFLLYFRSHLGHSHYEELRSGQFFFLHTAQTEPLEAVDGGARRWLLERKDLVVSPKANKASMEEIFSWSAVNSVCAEQPRLRGLAFWW